MAFKENPNDGHGEVAEDQTNERPAPFDTLPEECILGIIDYLSKRDLISLTLVSKRLNTFTDRAFRLRFTKEIVTIETSPSMRVQRFGSSIRRLAIWFDISDETLEGIFELYPNLVRLSLVRMVTADFSKLFYHKMFSQLHILSIGPIVAHNTLEMPKFREDFKVALQHCKNLISLRLGISKTNKSIYEQVFEIAFPKLRNFTINLDQTFSNDLFIHFLQCNTNINSLEIVAEKARVDFSGISMCQHLQYLYLNKISVHNQQSIIPHLSKLNGLRSLMLSAKYTRELFEPFFYSLRNLQHLTHLYLRWNRGPIRLEHVFPHIEEHLFDFRDRDLMQLQYLQNLTLLSISLTSGATTSLTLTGIFGFLELCPNLIDFRMDGFRQNFSPDGTLLDDDLYEKFRNAFFKQENRNVEIILKEMFNCKWYEMREIGGRVGESPNLIDLYKRCRDFILNDEKSNNNRD